jgi:hypothetical protein
MALRHRDGATRDFGPASKIHTFSGAFMTEATERGRNAFTPWIVRMDTGTYPRKCQKP